MYSACVTRNEICESSGSHGEYEDHSSGMLRRGVSQKWTDVSEMITASIMSDMMMEAANTYQTSADFYEKTITSWNGTWSDYLSRFSPLHVINTYFLTIHPSYIVIQVIASQRVSPSEFYVRNNFLTSSLIYV
jgi:hypothetical protein